MTCPNAHMDRTEPRLSDRQFNPPDPEPERDYGADEDAAYEIERYRGCFIMREESNG